MSADKRGIPDTEPVIHSHHEDGLAEDDPRAYETIDCQRCKDVVHAGNNECMMTWVEWGEFVLCGRCFMPLLADGVLDAREFVMRCQSEETA